MEYVSILKIVLIVIVDWLILSRVFTWMFPNREDAIEALRLWIQPGWFSLLRGELGRDVMSEFKLGGFIVFAIILILLEIVGFSMLGEWVRQW